MSGFEFVALGIATAASTAGTVLSAAAQAQQAQAQADAAAYNAALADRNSKILQNEALQKRNEAQVEASDRRQAGIAQMARIRAAYGASGVDAVGSPLEVLTDASAEIALDAARTEYAGELEAIAIQEGSTGQKLKAYSLRRESKNYSGLVGTSLLAGGIGAVGDLAGGAYKAAALAR